MLSNKLILSVFFVFYNVNLISSFVIEKVISCHLILFIKNKIITLENNSTLKILNLSKNKLTSASSNLFNSVLRNNDSLEELYLHYNKLTCEFLIEFTKGLKSNYFLRVLDLS